MDNIANQIVSNWKKEIESINSDITRIVSSVDCFRMNRYYSGHPEIEYCYKVNFNFKDGFEHKKIDFSSWAIELNRHFKSKFGQGKAGANHGEIVFKNEICDYMTYQGYRFIIQFYPAAFLQIIREEKLNQLGI